MKILSIFLCVFVTFVASLPQRRNLDKNTDIDVALNDIGGDKDRDFGSKENNRKTTTESPVPSTTEYIPSTTTHKPQSAIARILDDIFQIPITVLQSVSKLLTNPFLGWNNKTPETARGY